MERYMEIVKKRNQETLSKLEQQGGYIWGAARMGRFVYQQLQSKYHIIGYIDNNKSKSEEMGLKIYRPDEVDKDAPIIIASLNAWNDILTECQEKGFSYYCNYEELAYIDEDLIYSNDIFQGMSEGILNNLERYQAVYERLEDNVSQEIFKLILQSRLLRDIKSAQKAYVLSCANSTMQYFDPQIVKLSTKDVFVDCGGYKGETTETFLEANNNLYKAIYYFEPDSNLMEISKQVLKQKENIKFFSMGVGSANTELFFNATGGPGGKFCDEGSQQIKVVTLDDVVDDNVTFIKMDIEGMEKDALLGAKKILKHYKPTLAISVYHKSTDIIDIAECVLGIRDDYKIYLRHYTKSLDDTVMYFV